MKIKAADNLDQIVESVRTPGSHLLSDVFLNIIKCCTQKLRGRASTIYFAVRKDAPDQGIRQVPDHNWHPVEKSVHGLGPQTRDFMVRNRLRCGGTKFKSFCLKSGPMGQPCNLCPGAVRGLSQCHQLHCTKGGSELMQTKPPRWERSCSGSFQHSCSHANMLLLWRIHQFS